MLTPVIAARLRERGHDVQTVKGGEHEALSDSDVMGLAIAPGGDGHFAMAFMSGSYRRTKADTGRIVKALEDKLREFPGERDLANGETWLLRRPCRPFASLN